MDVNVKVKHGFNQILKEMGGEKTEDIMVLKTKDRFFVGYGCEPRFSDLPLDLRSNRNYLLKARQNSVKNISICADRP